MSATDAESVAICGKGGVGKTTLAALLARSLADGHRGRVLVVDADPAGGLSLALGLRVRRSLDDLRRELIAELAGDVVPDATDLVATADFRLMESLVERGSLAFLAVGRPEEAGCYCQLNSFLRSALEALCSQFQLTLIDAEAGIEQVNRRVMQSVTRLLLVSDPSVKGLKVAEAIAEVAVPAARSLEVGLVLNRVADEALADRLAGRTRLPLLGRVPEDPTVGAFDAQARSFLEIPASSAALRAARALLEQMFTVRP
jgi:CO dehydrogenase maturation factor